jgi:hypothetical protein
MRTLLLICAGLTVISCIVSANLWRELRSQHVLNAALQTQLAAAASRSREPAPPTPPAINPAPPPAAIAPAPATVAAAPEARPATTAMRPDQAQARQDAINRERALWQDPEYRAARLAQARGNLQRQHLGLAEELGLTDAEEDKLLDLLAEHQVTLNMEMNAIARATQNDPVAQQEVARKQAEMARQREASVSSLLGAKYPVYQQYQQNAGGRSGVSSMNSTLAQAGTPMNAAQIKTMTTVMAAEQQRQQQEMQALTRNMNSQDPEARTRMNDEMQRRSLEASRRILEAASSVLSPQQVATLRAEVESQEAMSRASSRIRERTQAVGGQ